MKRIETQKGLKELLRRYQEANADIEWINTIKECIEQELPMDEMDYENTPLELRKLWKGLK